MPSHFLIFFHRPLHLNWMNLSSSFNLWSTFLYWWPPDQATWTIRSLELSSTWRATPSYHQMAKMAQRGRGVWQHPIPITIPVHGEETNTWPPWDSVYFGDSSDCNQRWGNSPTCLAGTSGGRHAPRWQVWPNRSSSDGTRLGHPVLWKAISRRGT